MKKICASPKCSNAIPPQKGSARPRKFCIECRPPRNRPNPRVIKLAEGPPLPSKPEKHSRGLVATYRDRLERSERLDTPEGAHVMLLAELLVTGDHTAAGAASLSKELRAAMDAALAGAPKAADRLDELASRRDRKANGA